MREIKFRAWDKVLQKMIYNRDDIPDIEKWGNEIMNHPYDEDEWYPMCEMYQLNAIQTMQEQYCDKLIFMQYTGLKDKNGKEIYEGDILDHGYGKHPVVWNTYRWELADGHSILWSDMCEVIGNIYENPELLKEEK